MVRIDLPVLLKVTIWLFNDISFEIPQRSLLIPRLNALGPPNWGLVTHSEESVGVFFVQEGKSSNE